MYVSALRDMFFFHESMLQGHVFVGTAPSDNVASYFHVFVCVSCQSSWTVLDGLIWTAIFFVLRRHIMELCMFPCFCIFFLPVLDGPR